MLLLLTQEAVAERKDDPGLQIRQLYDCASWWVVEVFWMPDKTSNVLQIPPSLGTPHNRPNSVTLLRADAVEFVICNRNMHGFAGSGKTLVSA